MRTYPITRAQARELHNGVCYMRDTMDKLEEVFKPEFFANLKSGFKCIDKVRASLYEIIDAEQEALWTASRDYAESNDITVTLWSYEDVDSFDSEHGFPIGTILKSWETSTTVKITSPTWGGLWKDVENWVKANKHDFGNHVFIENFVYDKKEKAVKVYFGN